MGSVNTLDGKSPRLKRNEKIRENRSNKTLFYIVRFVFKNFLVKRCTVDCQLLLLNQWGFIKLLLFNRNASSSPTKKL